METTEEISEERSVASGQETARMGGCGFMCQRFFSKISRTKYIDANKLNETRLARCLGTVDLAALGVGATLGAGIYVVAGQVARQIAGPSVILSFLIAAVASVFAGLCYAEFGARVPKTGSAYVYSYVTVGELWAFVIGWNLILEYVIGTASVARALSTYFDSIIGGHIEQYFEEHFPMHVTGFSSYPDLFAFGITLILTGILCLGVKESSIMNNLFTLLNIVVVTYVVVCGMFKANFHNWALSKDEVPSSSDSDSPTGNGGFFPFGVTGMLSGAATCFYAFVGFDVIATTGEEVRNPQKAIPVAIVCSLCICFLAYFGVSATLTLMVPYYTLDKDAPIPKVFEAVGWNVAKYIITAGAMAGLSTSLLGGMFPMPRIIYAMADDGLVFRGLAWVPERFKTPVAATITSGVMAATMAMLFDLRQLVEMMSIGTLLAYTLVAACVLILRYRRVPFPSYDAMYKDTSDTGSINMAKVDTIGVDHNEMTQLVPKPTAGLLADLFTPDAVPSEISERISKISVSLLGLILVVLAAFLVFCESPLLELQTWTFVVIAFLILIILILIVIIWRQPENTNYVTFKVPAVPVIATASMFINVYLMMKLTKMTWIRFAIWLGIGFIIYFGYGIWFSSEEQRQKYERQMEQEISEPEPVSEGSTSTRTENTSLIYEGT